MTIRTGSGVREGTMGDRPQAPANWRDILRVAVTVPGTVSRAYTSFHGYSLGNQMLALMQCAERGLQPGPIATYPAWRERGRQVRRGERAIALFMPVTGKRPVTRRDPQGNEVEEEATYTRFILRSNWFVLGQTDGADVAPEPVRGWDRAAALASLGISEVPFDSMNGNVQGFARRGRRVSVSPVAAMPHKTLFHEMAHALLHDADSSDSEETPYSLGEVEAESVALLCCESLGLPGAEFSRGYIQNWGGFREIPEKSCQRIFKAATQILAAGGESCTSPTPSASASAA